MASFVDFPIEAATPMMQQYLKVKAAHPEYILLYRMGDFYEFFFEDAIEAAKVLDIALTRRDKQNDIPMCGIPFHAIDNYIPKLIKAGYKVAICDQLETPEQAKERGYKAVVRREVTRIITSGTITEDNLLEKSSANFLISVSEQNKEFAISWIDISTGDFKVASSSEENLATDIAILGPKEILVSTSLYEDPRFKNNFTNYKRIVTTQVPSFFQVERARKNLLVNYKISSLESFGDLTNAMISCLGSIIEYLKITHLTDLPNLPYPKIVDNNEYMSIDQSTRSNLELDKGSDGSSTNSLLTLLDNTITAFGSRLFKSIFARPLISPEKINDRLDKLEFFLNNPELTETLRKILESTPDVERALSRLSYNRGGPRDLTTICTALESALKLAFEIDNFNSGNIPKNIMGYSMLLGGHESLIRELKNAIKDPAPILTRDGNFIRPSYHPKIDELRELSEENQSLVEKLRQKYQQITKINNLKISKNNVLGYFIEVTSQYAGKLIADNQFIHRQTLANNARFTTVELQELESKSIHAKDQLLRLELEIFDQIVASTLARAAEIMATASSMAAIDVFTSLAFVAKENNYTRPIIDTSLEFKIENGRHPVVEKTIKKQACEFVENSCNFPDYEKIWLITGPNMAGKSTFLRQNALIVIMAQIGSFVPASFAHIGVVDRLFSRIGASDDLASGRSTFMVEMTETAIILNQATKRSLIILDEIGRGTATYDGLAIAWSTLEYIHDKIAAKTLFATHYHELTALASQLKKLKCYQVKVKEWQKEIIFLHKVEPGSADKSYGIHVASIAGFPKEVTNRAKIILEQLEKTTKNNGLINDTGQFSLSLDKPKPRQNHIFDELLKVNLDNISPREALDILHNMQQSLCEVVI